MCEIYGFCGNHPTNLNKYTNEFWLHSKIHQDGFGYYLADKRDLYTNPKSAMHYLWNLNQKDFTSKLALCHIRFKTHGEAKQENCHPFIKQDCHCVSWSLIHNGYIDDNRLTASLGTLQIGETDSERILLAIVESINDLYEHSWFENESDRLGYLYVQLEYTLRELSFLGRTNLIFTDDETNNMYVFMNHRNTLFFLKTDDGYHFSTVPLSDEKWFAIEPNTLHVFNNGVKII